MKRKSYLLLFLALPLAVAAQNGTDNALTSFADRNAKIQANYACQRSLINLNQNAYTTKNYDAVITKANECLVISPSAISYEIRAGAYASKGDLNAALTDYNLAVKRGRLEMDSAKIFMQEMGGAFQNNYESSRDYLVTIYINRAEVYMLRNDRKNAEADLKAALVIVPGDYKASDNLKNLDDNMAKKQKEARIANPKTADDFVLAGIEQSGRGKDKEALAFFDKAIAMDAKNAGAYIGRGDVNRQSKSDPDAAIIDYNKAVATAPKLADAYTKRGYAYLDKKDWDAAINDLSKAMSVEKTTAALLNARGAAYIGKGKNNEALADYNKSALLAGDDMYGLIGAISGQGDAYNAMGKKAEALAAYTKAIDKGKADFFANIFLLETYVNRGKMYAADGLKDKARADFNAALKISPKHAEAKGGLAKLNN